ncbi:MAG: hypothetical protein A3I11_08550 [Elusimicrobia bacterium RIFCSPLOWO2_02_FULL_39_32]|nr:MAG: hypothetical protein A2034_03950 [Elusimicrobia bacterium GWA2_38_7]OGR79317.1 MAG: hypothetical protein A3B80_08815 [Elusimicrobia bacterium RIFCSPHIGHO2_02_FULL_39_36]OGR93218.1 MAG: hypothetical protein A3I11_08550 [Elusimicrobia bacterium RIFCSPLOWO2_02_FULL_39_32]OGR99443.1 MAG: hypothetical protein A3G85_06995 [Elusimicrobia bacterium RIFCSPLOWO2_12_FULL_39_28]
MLKKNKFYWLALIFIFFNVWHSSMRGIWNHSIFDALTIGSYTLELAHKTDPGIKPWKSYDGQFFYALTFDPLLISKSIVQYLDSPLYRYQRMGYPFLAHLAVLGKAAYYPFSLFILNILGWFSIGVALWKIARLEKLNPFWCALAGIFTTGLTYATFRTLSETLMTAFILWGLYFWKKRFKNISILLFSIASLVREVAILVPLSILIHEIYFNKNINQEVAEESSEDGKKSALKKNILHLLFSNQKIKNNIMLSLIPMVLVIIWHTYVSARLSEFTNWDINRITFPFGGIIKEGWIGISQKTSLTEHSRTLSILFLTILLIPFTLYLFFKHPTFWGTLCVIQSLFCTIVKGDVWNYHASSARVIILLTIFSILWFFEIGAKNFNPEFKLTASLNPKHSQPGNVSD